MSHKTYSGSTVAINALRSLNFETVHFGDVRSNSMRGGQANGQGMASEMTLWLLLHMRCEQEHAATDEHMNAYIENDLLFHFSSTPHCLLESHPRRPSSLLHDFFETPPSLPCA
jgi:hypothetical protein